MLARIKRRIFPAACLVRNWSRESCKDHLQVLIESFDNDTLIYGPDNLLFDLAVLDYEQRWNATNIKTRGSRLIRIHVQLSYFDTALVLFGDGINRRGQCTAGRTPRRPEIDQNRCGRLLDFRLEIGVIDLDSICAHVSSKKIYSSFREYQKSIAYTGATHWRPLEKHPLDARNHRNDRAGLCHRSSCQRHGVAARASFGHRVDFAFHWENFQEVGYVSSRCMISLWLSSAAEILVPTGSLSAASVA